MFALVVEGREVRSSDGSLMASEGERFLVVKGGDSWATSERYDDLASTFHPINLMTFKTREEAEKFAKEWRGHPWWCKPNGNFEVLSVTPKYERKVVGYEFSKAAKKGRW